MRHFGALLLVLWVGIAGAQQAPINKLGPPYAPVRIHRENGYGLRNDRGSTVVRESPKFALLPVKYGARGAPVPLATSGFCTNFITDFNSSANWACADPTNGIIGTIAFSTVAVTTVTPKVCNNGPDCATIPATQVTTTNGQVVTTSNVTFPTGSFSYCGYVRAMGPPNGSSVGVLAGARLTTNVWELNTNTLNALRMFLFKSGGSTDISATTGTTPYQADNYICMTYAFVADGTSIIRFYNNGVDVGGTGAAVGPPQAHNTPMTIAGFGGANGADQGMHYLALFVDGVVLTPTQIAAHNNYLHRPLVSSNGGVLTVTRAGPLTCTNDNWASYSTVINGDTCTANGKLQDAFTSANLALRSRELDNASWTKTNCTANTGIDGKNNAAGIPTMDKVVCNANTGVVAQTLAVSSTTGPFTASAYFAADTGTQKTSITITCPGTTPATCTCQRWDGNACTTATSTTDCTGSSTFTVNPARVSVTATCTAAVTAPVISLSAEELNVAANGTAWITDAQFENGTALASPIIFTTSATVTRPVQIIGTPFPSSVLATAGCAKVCATPAWAGTVPTGPGQMYQLWANNAGRIQYIGGAGANGITAFDGTHAPVVGTTFSRGTEECFLTQWSAAANSLRITNLTTAATSSTAFTTYTFNTVLNIGSSDAAGSYFGELRDIIVGATPEACTL